MHLQCMYSRLLLAIQETIYYGLFNPLDTKNYAPPPLYKANIYLDCRFEYLSQLWI